MKRLTLILVAIAISTAIQAQKVALHSSGGVQFFTGTGAFAQAFTASADGDTIYLPGGGFSTPSSINKNLRIYGAGHYPDSTLATGKTVILGQIQLASGASGTYIEGVEITGDLIIPNNVSVNHVTILRCRINGNVTINGNLTNPSTNFNIQNSVVIGNVILNNAQNAGIFNNILQGRLQQSSGNVIRNNIFLYSYSGPTSFFKLQGDNNDIFNNVFWDTDNRYITGNTNRISNNIFVASNPALGTNPQTTINYFPVDQGSIFVNQTGNNFSYDHNYHLQTPETYPGTDLLEAGVYGGFHPYKEGAVPSNPHIIFKTIAPATDENGRLIIEIKAGAQKR